MLSHPPPRSAHPVTSETGERVSSEGQFLPSSPTQTPPFWFHHCPVFGQPPRQDERAVAEGTHFGDTVSVACGLLAVLWGEAAFSCAPKEGHRLYPGPCSPPATLAVLRTGILSSQSRSAPFPTSPYHLLRLEYVGSPPGLLGFPSFLPGLPDPPPPIGEMSCLV